MDYMRLKAEIRDDPKGLGYAGKSEAQTADMLNAPGVESVARGTVSRNTLIGDLAPVVMTLVQQSASSPKAAAWLAIYDRLLAPKETVNLQNGVVQQMFAQIAADGYMTVSQQASLLHDPASRAEWLLGQGSVVTARDVHNARTGEW